MASIKKDDSISNQEQFLEFCCGGYTFAIEVGLAKEVSDNSPLTPIPAVKSYVKGLANIRGESMVVLDFANLIGIKRAAECSQFIQIRDSKNGDFALAVERVVGLNSLAGKKECKSDGPSKNLIEKCLISGSDKIFLVNGKALQIEVLDLHISAKLLILAPESQPFWLGDGEKATSLSELLDYLKTIDEGSFTLKKKDFAAWIRNSLKLPDLANLVDSGQLKAVIARLSAG